MNSIPVLTDADIDAHGDMREAIAAVEQCFLAKSSGQLVAPPRHAVKFGTGSLVFTVGGLLPSSALNAVAGFRVYETFEGRGANRADLVAVWDADSGDLLGLVLGQSLGALRTGAIGGVAIDRLARPDAATCAVIGSGRQAEMQLRAAIAVRPRLQYIRVFSRSSDKRRSFADRLTRCLNRAVEAVDDAEQAVAGADILLCATDSEVPVLDANWFAPGVHVNAVGPKLIDGHDLPIEIGQLATVAATDSPEQLHAYARPYFLQGTPIWNKIGDLASIVSGRAAGRRNAKDVSLFCSVGLAGTEVAVASAMLRRLRP